MRTTKWFAVTVAAALTAGGFIGLTSHAAPGNPSARPGRMLERLKTKLDLTDAQVAKIKDELAAQKDTLKDLVTRAHEARVTLREAIQASSASEASVRAAAARVGEVQADMAVERFKLYGRISPILTDEQKEKVKALQDRVEEFFDNAVRHFGERWSGQSL